VQTLADINIRRWGFPAGGILSIGGSLSAGEGHSASGSTVESIIGLRPRTASGTSRFRGSQRVVGVLLLRSLECERLCVGDARSEATCRESSSIRSSSPAVLSVVEVEMLAVVSRGVTSQILSAWWVAESRLPSVWQVIMACTCSGIRLAHMVRRKSSGTSGSRLLSCRINCDVFRSSIFSRERSCLTRFSREVDNRRTKSALSRS